MDILSGIAGLAGGLVSGGLNWIMGERRGDEAAHLQAQNIQLQREFAQNSLQWRARDAKAAGLHPLSAVAAQLPSFQPVVVGDSGAAYGDAMVASSVGNTVEGAIGRLTDDYMSQKQRNRHADAQLEMNSEMMDQQLGTAKRQNELLDVDLEMKRLELWKAKQALIANHEANTLTPRGQKTGAFLFKPTEIVSRDPADPSLTAGPGKPAWDKVQFGDGLFMVLPQATTVGEALEAISESKTLGALIMAENIRRFGPEWKEKFLSRGRDKPKFTPAPPSDLNFNW